MAPGPSLSRPLLPGFSGGPAAPRHTNPGKPHALEVHRPRTPPGPVPDAPRGAPEEESPPPSPGPLFDRPQSQTQCLEGPAREGETCDLADPDCERGPGVRDRGATGLFVSPDAGLLHGATFPRRSPDLHPRRGNGL